MFRAMVRSVLIIVLAASVLPHSFALELEQRRPRPSNNISNGLDVLGLWQPESVRAILLLYSGKSLSKAKAEQLEAELRKTPDKVDDRLVLIGYYSENGKTTLDHTRLRSHVLWMVETHPEHPATAEPSLRDVPDDPEANVQIMTIWRNNIAAGSDDLAVLKNAEKYFFSKDPAEAERLIHYVSEREPNNREWANELAQLYRMFGIPGRPITDAAERAEEAYKRVLALTRGAAAREALAGDMAAAAFKVGDFKGAAQLARIHLQGKDHTAPQRANTILGRVAIRTGDLPGAKQYLLDSGSARAVRDVSLAGPTMVLAKELLEEGESQTVLEYLDNCLTLWPRGEEVLHIWMADIKSGKMPKFGNLAF